MAYLFNDKTRPPEPSQRAPRPAKWSSVSGSAHWFYEAISTLHESLQEFHGKRKLVCRLFQYPYIADYQTDTSRRMVEDALKAREYTKFHPMVITGIKETYTPISVETLMLNGKHHYDRLGVSPLSIDVSIMLPAIHLKGFLMEFDAYKKSLQSRTGLSLLGVAFSNFVLTGLYNYISVSYNASSPGVAQVSLNMTVFDILRDFSGMYTDLLSDPGDPEVHEEKELMALVMRPYRESDVNYGNVRRPTKIRFNYHQDAVANGQQYSPRERLDDKTQFKRPETEEGTFIASSFTFGDTSVVNLFKSSFGTVGQVSSISPYEFSIIMKVPPSPNGGDEVKRFLWNYLIAQEQFKYTYVDVILPQGESNYFGLKGVLQPFSVEKIAKSPSLDTFNLTLRVSSLTEGFSS